MTIRFAIPYLCGHNHDSGLPMPGNGLRALTPRLFNNFAELFFGFGDRPCSPAHGFLWWIRIHYGHYSHKRHDSSTAAEQVGGQNFDQGPLKRAI